MGAALVDLVGARRPRPRRVLRAPTPSSTASPTRGGPTWLSIDWDAWDNAAEAQMAGMPTAIQPAEGQEAFLRLLRAPGRIARGRRGRRPRRTARVVGPPVRGRPAAGGGGERHPRPNLATPFVEPASETERTLAEIWASQLGLDKVGVHDRFFDLGGHSLLAVQVASEIRDRFQIEMPVLQLFKAPTIARAGGARRARRELTGGVVDRPRPPTRGRDRRRRGPVRRSRSDRGTGRRRQGELPRVLRRRHAGGSRPRAWARRRSS